MKCLDLMRRTSSGLLDSVEVFIPFSADTSTLQKSKILVEIFEKTAEKKRVFHKFRKNTLVLYTKKKDVM